MVVCADFERDASGRNAVQDERAILRRRDAGAHAPVAGEARGIGFAKADVCGCDTGLRRLVVNATAQRVSATQRQDNFGSRCAWSQLQTEQIEALIAGRFGGDRPHAGGQLLPLEPAIVGVELAGTGSFVGRLLLF